jgi:hypothetical protein
VLLVTKLVLAIAAAIAAMTPAAPLHVSARRMRPRPFTMQPRPGTVVSSSDVITYRVFANASDGFTLANIDSAQYPARSLDGGRTWRIDGPQVHIDAADGPEDLSDVGVAGPRTFFAYGSSAVDVTTDGGRTWWETFLGELVVAVVPDGYGNDLVAYVQEPLASNSIARAVTWQYVTRDGGRHWSYTPMLGGH